MILICTFANIHLQVMFTRLKIFMLNFDEINENYSSSLTEELLNSITTEEQERIDYKMMLAAKIYAALKSKGWKSLDLAHALDFKSPSLISKWLSGTHNFTVDTLVDIQRVLEINLVDVEINKPISTDKRQDSKQNI